MRMDQRQARTAADVVNDTDERELAGLLRAFGDERYARRIAKAIVAARPVATTTELAEIVRDAIPAPARRTGGHPGQAHLPGDPHRGERRARRPGPRHRRRPRRPPARRPLRRALVPLRRGPHREGPASATPPPAAGPDPAHLPPPSGVHPTVRLLKAGRGPRPTAEVAANPRASSARLRAAEKLDAPATPRRRTRRRRHAMTAVTPDRALTRTARARPPRSAPAPRAFATSGRRRGDGAERAPAIRLPSPARARRSDRTTSGWSLRRSGSGGGGSRPARRCSSPPRCSPRCSPSRSPTPCSSRARCASTSSTPSSWPSRRATRSCAPRSPSSSRRTASSQAANDMGMVTPDDLQYLQPPAPDASTVGPTTGDDDEPAADPTVGARAGPHLGGREAAAGGARAMTRRAGEAPSRTPPRGRRPATPPDRHTALPIVGGAVSRARPVGPPPRAPRLRPPAAVPPRPPIVGRPGRPRLRSGGALLVLLVGFGAIVARLVDVQAVGRRRVHDLRRVAAVPGHHAAGRPRLDLRSQRLRPGGEPAAADGVGEPAADRAPARGGHRAGRTARARPRRHDRAGRASCRGDAEFVYVARRVDDEVAAAIAELELPGRRLPRGARAHRAGRRPGPLGARSGRRRQRRPLRPRAAVRRRPHRRARRADHREGPRRPHHPRRRAPARAGAARRRPRAHHRPLDAVRDRARARRADPRQGRQGRHRDRVPPGDRRDPRAGQLHDRPGDGRDRRHRQQHGRDGGVRARLGEQGDHRGRRARGGPGHPRHRAHGARLAAR